LPDIISPTLNGFSEPDRRAPQLCGRPWDPFPMADPFPTRRVGGRSQTGLSHASGHDYLLLPPAPAQGDAAHRIGVAPFEPPDAVYSGHAQIGIQGSVIHTSAHETVATPGPVSILLEERFDSGWGNWTGQMEDWKTDAAGVRTGSFALFTPSLELCDYDLEFLARIESRSVTWVFRAASATEYFAASIALTSAGAYEFRRRAVIGGVEEPATSVHLRLAPGTKAALKVRMRVEGSEFAVSLDGQSIDTWTDHRLANGGIGFAGATDDRARLYWVRLSSRESQAKEYRKS
jgi:hypothetical protein